MKYFGKSGFEYFPERRPFAIFDSWTFKSDDGSSGAEVNNSSGLIL